MIFSEVTNLFNESRGLLKRSRNYGGESHNCFCLVDGSEENFRLFHKSVIRSVITSSVTRSVRRNVFYKKKLFWRISQNVQENNRDGAIPLNGYSTTYNFTAKGLHLRRFA